MKQSRSKAAFICGIVALGVIIWGVGKLFLTSSGQRSHISGSGWSIKAHTPEDSSEYTAPTTIIYPPSSELTRKNPRFAIEPTGYSVELDPKYRPDSQEGNELLVRGQQRSGGVALVPNSETPRPAAPNPLRTAGNNTLNNPAPLDSAPIRQANHAGEKLEFPEAPALGSTETGNSGNAHRTQPEEFEVPFGRFSDDEPAIPEFQDSSSFSIPDPEYFVSEVPHVPSAPRPIPSRPDNNFAPPTINVEYDPENELEPLGGNSLGGATPFDRNNNARSIRIEVAETPDERFSQDSGSRIPRIASSAQPGFTSPETISRQPVRNTEQATTGTGTPGSEKLEGPQMPQLILEKTGPKEITVNQQAVFKTTVRNTGKVPAKNIRIFDKIPLGASLSETIPRVEPGKDGELVWDLGTLDPQQELTVEMRIVPFQEGEIGSVATVIFSMDSSAKTVVTRPLLKLDVKYPEKVTIGEQVTFEITISNPGSGPATGVVLQELVPDGLVHEKGKELLNKVGTIKPKESKRFALTMQANKSGAIANYLCVKADNNLLAEDRSVVNVLAPQISLKIEGTKQRYLERRAVYRLTVSNPGSAPANDVSLSMTLPDGVKFESTDQSGVYDPQTNKVHWALETLPVQDTGVIELVVVPLKAGDYKMRFLAEGENLMAETSHELIVDGLAATSFTVTCLSDPVEIGKETVYEVRVTNRGTKTAKDIVLALQLSEGMTFLNADGPVTYKSKDSIVEFDSLGSLEAKKEKIYKVAARCDAPGDHRIRVQVVSEDLKEPVTKEESTKVFADK